MKIGDFMTIDELLLECNLIITKNKYYSNFDFISLFEKLNDKVIALLVIDENNELNQYRCCIDTMLNVSIQYSLFFLGIISSNSS